MAKVTISASRSTDKTIRAIDRKRERERRTMFRTAKDNAEPLAAKLVQRLLDQEIIEISSVTGIRKSIEDQFHKLAMMEDFDLQMKIAPVRTLVQDPNIVSLYLTQYVVEDLVDHPDVLDVFGDDLDVYRAIDSVLRVLRQQ
jgi:hypothetical protein